MVLLLSMLALGAPPDSVRPTVAPVDAPSQYAAWLAEQGLPGSELACEPLWPEHALLCFKVVDAGRRRWVTSADLAAWGTTLAELRARLTARARPVLATQPRRLPVSDMQGASYWLAAEGDGWAAAGLLNPDLLARRVGGAPILVATPTDSVLLAWRPGSAELDKVMAVGVRKMFDEEPGSVTPMVHRWDGEKWTPFGQAVPEP